MSDGDGLADVFGAGTDLLGFDVRPDELPAEVSLESRAVRMLFGQRGVRIPAVGVGVENGRLIVAWQWRPSLAEEAGLARMVGMPVDSRQVSPERFAALADMAARLMTSEASAPPVERYLDAAVDSGASDLHLRVGAPPHLRVGGRLSPVGNADLLSSADMDGIVAHLVGGDVDVTAMFDHDCAITYRGHRFRVNVYRQRAGWGAVLRSIPSVVPKIETLGLPQIVVDLARHTHGIVIVSGVTGSGKSTTLAGILDRINDERTDNIITLEDPIEYVHSNRKSLISQRELGSDTASFSAGLRAALREDPDVILVGEMRDNETIEAAIRAAETGHLVLSTLHAGTVPQAIDRIIDVYPAAQQNQIRVQLASTLVAIVCQKLVPATVPGQRRVATEVMVANEANRNSILNPANNTISQELQAKRDGMHLMDHSLARLVAAGDVDFDEARRVCARRDLFAREVADAEAKLRSAPHRMAG